jgi:hypothetical protein
MEDKKTTIKDTGSNGSVGSDTDAFMTRIRGELEKSAGIVSSFDTDIEKGISKAIEATQQGAKAGAARIESAFTREQNYAANIGTARLTTENEARRGMATNTGILKQIYADADKSIKDLEMRKQELIMQGEAEGAARISDLQIKELEFKQSAAQQTYANLMQMANLGLGMRAEDRLTKAQTFQEKQAIGSVALQFGLTLQPGETIDEVISRAAPFASERQKLELAQIRQDINESQQRINKMYQEGKATEGSMTNDDLYTVARAELAGDKGVSGIEMDRATAVEYLRVKDQARKDMQSELAGKAKEYTNKSDFEKDMLNAQYPNDLIQVYKSDVKTKGLFDRGEAREATRPPPGGRRGGSARQYLNSLNTN